MEFGVATSLTSFLMNVQNKLTSCVCHPAMGSLIHWGWVSPEEHPEPAHLPVAFDEMCVVLLHGVAASWHHVGAGGPVRGSAAGERADRIRGARSVQRQLLAGV